MKIEIDEPLTYNEVAKAVNKLKNQKSPGPDGYPAEFYKVFWDQIGYLYFRAIQENFLNGCLSTSQQQGVITCIPKGNKPRKFLKNWRPISLLNTSYKIISSCVAGRIKKTLNYIIGDQQKGFIEGRNIAECTREIYDFMFECEESEIPGLMLLIDFEKAFDSVAWDFILYSLERFHFPNYIYKWVELFQRGAESRVVQCGWLSDPFSLSRGCRQGDPVSPYIFIICAELLSQAIKNNPNIKGISIKGEERKLTTFADDTSLFLDASKKSLRKSIETLDSFREASGLKINIGKTKAAWLGSKRHQNEGMCHDLNLDWVHEFSALGIIYNVRDLSQITELNCRSKFAEIDKILLNWSRRSTTLLGRVTILKSLALSKIIHFLISLPSPGKDFFREIDKKFYRFLWKQKPPKIAKKTMEGDITDGGLKMVNLIQFDCVLKLKWIKMLATLSGGWSIIPTYLNINGLM